MAFKTVEVRYYNNNLIVTSSTHAVLEVETQAEIKSVLMYGVNVPT